MTMVEPMGSDVSLVSYGAMMRETREAAARLADEGVSAEIIDVRTLAPLDADTIYLATADLGSSPESSPTVLDYMFVLFALEALEVCLRRVYVGHSRSLVTPPVAPGRNNLGGDRE